MNAYFSNELIDNEIINSILNDIWLIKEIGDHERWIEYPLTLRSEWIIRNSNDLSLSIEQLIPLGLNLSDFMKEYILSWAYESYKLNFEAIDFFKIKFNKKYHMINNILSKN